MIDDAPDPDEVIDDAGAGTFTVREHNGTLIQGHTVNVYQALEVERRLPCNPIPSVDLRVALERYAPPSQLAAARDLLERTGALVLVAEPGSGARTTALHLLAGRRYAGMHELEPDGSPSGQAERLIAEVGHAHLIELDADGSSGWHRFCREVLGRANELRAAGSSFVVTTSTSTVWASAADSTLPVLRLDRPSALDVALAHLRGFEATHRVRWLDEPAVRDHLAAETRPRDAARLARLLVEAPDTETAVQEFEGWRDHLRTWFERDAEAVGHDDVAERAPGRRCRPQRVPAGANLGGRQPPAAEDRRCGGARRCARGPGARRPYRGPWRPAGGLRRAPGLATPVARPGCAGLRVERVPTPAARATGLDADAVLR